MRCNYKVCMVTLAKPCFSARLDNTITLRLCMVSVYFLAVIGHY